MKRITKYLLLVLLLGGVHAQIAFAETNQCANLSRNLRIGDKGEDVRLLQKVLNADKTTTVASSGPGAFGEETTYFGERTKNAVAKFQEAHFNEILVPAGLTRGSGFVGTFTRERIRAFCAKTALASVPTQLTTGSASGKLVIPPTTTLLKLAANSPVLANQNLTNLYSLINKSTTTSSGTTATAPKPLAAPVGEKLELTSLSDVQVSIGGKIVAHATGLDSSNNLVHVGTATIASLPPSKLGQITFTIPQHSSLGSQDI
jgi:peptidoglycan hydrolase-like protein with peptidoglycan-binding domain